MASTSQPSLEALIQKLKAIKAEDIMSTRVITTTEDALLADVAEICVNSRISGLPVVKAGELVGIITTTDLFMMMDMIKSGDVMKGGQSIIPHPAVRSVMSTDVVTVQNHISLYEIIALTKYRNIHTLPVYAGNEIVGVIGRRDIYKNFYRVLRELHL